jgi:hypothetical protein
MRKVTPRIKTVNHIKDAVGKVTYTNISPTMRAELVGYNEEKSWFITLPHPTQTKYNECAGQSFYVPTYMAICFNYQEE